MTSLKRSAEKKPDIIMQIELLFPFVLSVLVFIVPGVQAGEIAHKTTLEYRGKPAIQVIRVKRFAEHDNTLNSALRPAEYSRIAKSALSKQFGHDRISIHDIRFIRVMPAAKEDQWVVEASGIAWPDLEKEQPNEVKILVRLDGTVPPWLYGRR